MLLLLYEILVSLISPVNQTSLPRMLIAYTTNLSMPSYPANLNLSMALIADDNDKHEDIKNVAKLFGTDLIIVYGLLSQFHQYVAHDG